MRRGRVTMCVLVLLALTAGDADARRRKKAKPRTKPAPAEVTPAKAPEQKKVKVFDFTGLGIDGKIRTPQLLYFLGRIKQELEQASLEDRSFMPELVRSVDEGNL